MKRRNSFLVRAILTLLTICLVGVAYIASADCPECFKDHAPPLNGVSVKISADWNDANGNTNANLWNAVQGYHANGVNINGALESWNFAQNNEPGAGGQGILQSLFLDQNRADSTRPGENAPTVIIKKGDVKTGCAKTNMNGPPFVITLPPRILNMPPEWIAATIMHELGHVLGLAEGRGQCSGTIMNGCKPSGESLTKTVSFNDVDKARQAADPNARANCNATKRKPRPVPQTYVHPTPIYYRPTCYYTYEPVDYYKMCECGPSECICDPESPIGIGWKYDHTEYFLIDVSCY